MHISETVRTATNQDGAVLMEISQGQMFSINPIGSRIWQQLNDGRSPDEIAKGFVSDFGISREQALNDVNEFVQQLEAQQLVRSSEFRDSKDKLGAMQKGLFHRLFRWRNPHARRSPISGTEAIGNAHSR
jgi:coenzyme PQQ synthesis protein D (PqqD)